MFGPKNIWKNFESKKFTSEKIFGLKKILVEKNWVAKKCLVGKNSKFLGQKIFGSKKNVGSKKFESLPPFLRHRVKYGGLKRWRGVGMGVPFLGFRVAYISNLSLLESLEPFEKGSKI